MIFINGVAPPPPHGTQQVSPKVGQQLILL